MEYKKNLKTLLKYIFSLGLIVWLTRNFSFQEAIINLKNVNLYFLGIAFGFSILVMTIQSLRWKTLLEILPINLSLIFYFKYILLGYFYNSILPIGAGSDLIKSYSLGKAINNKSTAISSIFSAKVLGLFNIMALMWLAIIFSSPSLLPEWIFLPLILLSSFICISSALLFVFPKLIIGKIPSSKIQNHLSYFQQLNKHPKILFKAIFYSFLIQLFVSNVQLFFFKSVGAEITFFDNLLYFSVLALILYLPISVGGVGVREASSIYILTKLSGVSDQHCIQVSILAYILIMIQALIGWIAAQSITIPSKGEQQ